MGAERSDRPSSKLNELVKGRRGVTADSALNLDVTA
jgi:plasmid maintenance system antidote protein VapI